MMTKHILGWEMPFPATVARRTCRWLGLQSVAAAVGVLALSSAAFASSLPAFLGDWVGENNMEGTNDYAVTSPTSAGGTFQARPDFLASLSDHALDGGPFGFDTDLSMAGTLTFDNPDGAAANFFFGFFNSAGTAVGNTHRLGLSLGDQPANEFRMQVVANNGASTNTRNLNEDGSGTAADPLGPGTYDFSIAFDAATRELTGVVGPVSNSVTLSAAFDQTDVFDRFGFRQWNTAITPPADWPSVNVDTFTFHVENVQYNGMTPIPEPSSLALLAMGVLLAVHRRRQN